MQAQMFNLQSQVTEAREHARSTRLVFDKATEENEALDLQLQELRNSTSSEKARLDQEAASVCTLKDDVTQLRAELLLADAATRETSAAKSALEHEVACLKAAQLKSMTMPGGFPVIATSADSSTQTELERVMQPSPLFDEECVARSNHATRLTNQPTGLTNQPTRLTNQPTRLTNQPTRLTNQPTRLTTRSVSISTTTSMSPSDSLLRHTVASKQWDASRRRLRGMQANPWVPSDHATDGTFGSQRFLQEPTKDADRYPYGLYKRGTSSPVLVRAASDPYAIESAHSGRPQPDFLTRLER